MQRALVGLLAAVSSTALANGRPPQSTSVAFRPGDDQAVYVGTTFGFFVSPDTCHFYWLCEQDIGFGGEFDPHYAVTRPGTLLATTFQGIEVSRDGGCSFSAQLASLYTSGLAVGPTGDVWVGTSESGSANAVYLSSDDAHSFEPSPGLPGTMWFQSLAVAQADPTRVYVSGYQNGGLQAPTSHLFRTDDHGQSWGELSVAAIAFGPSPSLEIAGVGPDANTVFVISRLANPPYGDRLYRTRDAGATMSEVLATASSISGVVVDAARIEVATKANGLFESTDGGTTFAPVATQQLQFACLGERDGVLFACASNYPPDSMALASSRDARTWTPVLQFEYITGPLSCPAGTVESDVCDQQMWRSLTQQLGTADGSACATGSSAPMPELPRDGMTRRSGCCDSAPAGGTGILVVVIALVLGPRRIRPR